MSATKVNVGLFFAEIQQSITAIGTFCELDGLTIANEPAKDKLADLLGRSIEVTDVLSNLLVASRRVTNAFRALGDAEHMFGRPGQIAECENAMIALDHALARIGSAA